MLDRGFIVGRNGLPVHYFVSNTFSLKVISNSLTSSTNGEILCRLAPMTDKVDLSALLTASLALLPGNHGETWMLEYCARVILGHEFGEFNWSASARHFFGQHNVSIKNLSVNSNSLPPRDQSAGE